MKDKHSIIDESVTLRLLGIRPKYGILMLKKKRKNRFVTCPVQSIAIVTTHLPLVVLYYYSKIIFILRLIFLNHAQKLSKNIQNVSQFSQFSRTFHS